MGLVDSWLEGIGLGYAVPIFAGQGINSPEMLSELDVVDFPELGISDQNDRKKLFYLIQRVRLAIERARAGNNKAAPQADSAVSASAATAVERQEEVETGAAGIDAAQEAQLDNAASTSVRFRRELEVPAARDAVAPRAANTKGNIAGGGGGRAGGRHTPAKVQRLPLSHRRPKTPHVDGIVRQQTGSKIARPEDGGRVREQLAAAENARQTVAAAAAVPSIPVLAVENAVTVGAYPQDSETGRGGRASAAAFEQQPSQRENIRTPSEQRSVLEPVQLDEAGVPAGLSEARGLVPLPSAQHYLAQRDCGGQVVPSRADSRLLPARDRPESREQVRGQAAAPTGPRLPHGGEEQPVIREVLADRRYPDGDEDVPARTLAAPLLPANADTVGERAKPAVVENDVRHPTGRIGVTTPHSVSETRVVAAAAAASWTQEMTHMPPSNREAGAAAAGGGGERDRPEARHRYAESSWVESIEEEEEEEVEYLEEPEPVEEADVDAETAEDQQETAAELAVHLISAHREDVRSALAAARKDMDLVSKADQDRHPAALLAYAREVEGVLGARLAAGARLRAALDSYVAMRQASSRPQPERDGLREGRARTRRAVQA